MKTRITRTGKDKQKQFIDLSLDIAALLPLSHEAATVKVNEELEKAGHAKLCRTLDGIGLQINFMINIAPYLIAGTSMGELLSSNGGKIENGDASLVGRIGEEIPEETFYGFKLNNTDGKLSLFCSINNKTYPLEFTDNAHISDNPNYNMAYITIQSKTAAENLEELKDIAAKLSPTAGFLNPIGNWIHKNRSPSMFSNRINNDENFSTWWSKKTEEEKNTLNAEFKTWWDSKEMQDKRDVHFADVEANHAKFVAQSPTGTLLVDLHNIFGGQNFAQGFANYKYRVNNTFSISDFWRLKSDQVGVFSERPNYQVVSTKEMQAAANENRIVKDVDGNPIAEVFDADAVRAFSHNPKPVNPNAALQQNSVFAFTPPANASAPVISSASAPIPTPTTSEETTTPVIQASIGMRR